MKIIILVMCNVATYVNLFVNLRTIQVCLLYSITYEV